MNIAILMDPIESIKRYKDTSFAMMLEAQRRGHRIGYFTQDDMWMDNGIVMGEVKWLKVQDQDENYYEILSTETQKLGDLDVIFMRKDPPFDNEYLYATHLLSLIEAQGARVINNPQSIRDCNEKLFTAWFPHCCVPTHVSANKSRLKAFVSEHKDVIVKPLDGMGGQSIFRLKEGDPNTTVILDTLTQNGTQTIMAQRFIPEITEGDKRILIIHGKPVPYALARIPAEGETRGNIAAGGTGVGRELSERDYWLCKQIAPTLVEKGLDFVGLDVIGDYITEINVTSPTCVRELDNLYNINILEAFFDYLEQV